LEKVVTRYGKKPIKMMVRYHDPWLIKRIDKIFKILDEIESYKNNIRTDILGIEQGNVHRAIEYDGYMEMLYSAHADMNNLSNDVKDLANAILEVGMYGERLERKVFDLVGNKRVS